MTPYWCECAPAIIPISFELDAAALGSITESPASWATLQTDISDVIVIEAVQLELEGIVAASQSLALFADPYRQVTRAGSARTIWRYLPAFATACPPWLVPGPTLAGGYRAECRLPLVVRARTLRLWTDANPGPLTVSGTLYYRAV